MMSNEPTISERLQRLEDVTGVEHRGEEPKQSFMDKLKGTKRLDKDYKPPRKVRAGWKGKVKKNYAVVMYVRTNGGFDYQWCPIVDSMIYIKQTGLYHGADTESIFWYKGIPFLLVFEGATEPLSYAKYLSYWNNKGDNTNSQKVIIRMLKKAELDMKKGGINGKWLLIGIGIIAALFILYRLLNK